MERSTVGTPIDILPAKNTVSLNDTITVTIKIPTQLYDSATKSLIEYRNKEIYLHAEVTNELTNTSNFFLSKDFEVIIGKGFWQEYTNKIRRRGVLLTATNDYYELKVNYVAKNKGKFGLYFNMEIPKTDKDDCNIVAYDVVSLRNDSLQNLNKEFLKRNPSFKTPQYYYYRDPYSGWGIYSGWGAYLMIEVQ